MRTLIARLAAGYAQLAERRGDRHELIRGYRAAIRRDPRPARWHHRLGRALYAEGDWRAAIVSYRAAVARDPSDARWHYHLGRANSKMKDWPAAIDAYRAAIERDDSHARSHYHLARALAKMKDWPAAIDAYRAAIERDSKRGRWHYHLGRANSKMKDWPAAIDAYRAAIERDDSHARSHYHLARALARAKDHLGADRAYRRAHELSSRGGDADGPSRSVLPYTKQIELSLLPKAPYAYCIHKAAQLAADLGWDRISVLELGVAGGNGLVRMERHAADAEEITGTKIDVYGFDTGEGLYEPRDHRDMPYFFKRGNYSMDVAALEQRLERAELIIGDAGETVAQFLSSEPAPIGAISFDMDVHSSTAEVLRGLGDGATEELFLPRTPLYFDNVVGRRGQEYNRFTGELLAIEEFNAANDDTKIAEDRHFRALPLNYGWYRCIFTMHRFAHPDYDTYVGFHSESTLSLRV